MSAPGALLCRTGDGRTRALDPGVAVYLWTSDGLRAAWAASEATLRRLRPDVVILHGPPSSITNPAFAPLVAQVRAALPGVRVWVGVGGDGWADEWRAGKASTTQVVDPLVASARAARAVGAECVVWDFEAAWKRSPKSDVRTGADLGALARRVVREGAAAASDAVHAVTTYDHPGLHTALPWASFLVGTEVSVYLPQYYAADGTPDRGELLARVRRAQASQAAAERAGMLPPDVTPDVAEDVDRVPVVQLHQLATADLVTVLAESPLVGAWALPLVADGGRADEAGLLALEAALRIRHAVATGPGAVAAYQASKGLTADGVCGPRTLDALLGPQRKGLA